MLFSRSSAGVPHPSSRKTIAKPRSARLACSSTYKVRFGRDPDAEGVAQVTGEAFGSGNFPGVSSAKLDALEERYMKSIARGVKEKLEKTLETKQQATIMHRELRLRRRITSDPQSSEISEWGRRRVRPRSPSLEERSNERKWIRQRKFVCLVAECMETGEVVGTASMSLMQPEALLPAPFPSFVPYRAYLYNMGVLTKHRRKGVAKALLQAAMRTARLWGLDSLWLHVHASRQQAMSMYTKQGFQAPIAVRGTLPSVKALMGEVLLKADLEPLHQHTVLNPSLQSRAAQQTRGDGQAAEGDSQLPGLQQLSAGSAVQLQAGSPCSSEGERDEELGVSGFTRSDGVFVWDLEVDEEETGTSRERQELGQVTIK